MNEILNGISVIKRGNGKSPNLESFSTGKVSKNSEGIVHGQKIDSRRMTFGRFPEMGGYPIKGVIYEGKSHRSKWMMTGGSPILGNHHMYKYV